MKGGSLRRLRPICLALPEAEERETWGEATFRVRNKIFCMHIADDKALWCKAPPGSQTILAGSACGSSATWIGARSMRWSRAAIG